MSDLASFVAATIRDKVVQELQEENANLRTEMAEKANANNIRHALYGDMIFHVAITGPGTPLGEGESPLVYAIDQIHIGPDGEKVTGTRFLKINHCTLGYLPQAVIWVNGLCFAPWRRPRLKFIFSIDAKKEGRAEITSLDDVFVTKSDDFVCFQVQGFGDPILVLWFELPDVSKEKFFEFASFDCNEFLANPRHSNVVREVSIDELIEFFGAETLVVFDEVDRD